MLFDLVKKFFGVSNIVQKPFPVVRADDEDEDDLIDPIVGLRVDCGKKEEALKLKEIWDKCEKRVLSKKHTTETCEEELHEYFEFVDHCVAHRLFDYLK